MAADGTTGRSLGRWPWYRTFRGPHDEAPRPLAFTPLLQITAFPDQVCIGYSEHYSIRCVDDRGTLQRQIGAQRKRIAVSSSMKAAYARGEAGIREDGSNKYAGALRAHRLRMAQTLQFAHELPAFGRMVAARTGELWVSDFRPEDGMPQYQLLAPPIPSNWRIFDRSGSQVGKIQLPPRFRLFDAGQDWVLGVLNDADDAESVIELRVVRRS